MATTEFEADEIRSRNKMLRNELDEAAELFSDETNRRLLEYLDIVPERNTAVHGDFHARNIYLNFGEPLLIDMDDFSLGHPVWDIACLYRVYPYLIEISREEAEKLFDIDDNVSYPDFYYQVMHLSLEEGRTVWNSLISAYFMGYDANEIDEYLKVVKVYSDFMVIRFAVDQCKNMKDNKQFVLKKEAFIKQILDRMDTFDKNEIKNILDGWK